MPRRRLRSAALPRSTPGIYPAREDTRLIAPYAAGARRGARVLDIGTGGGLLALLAARAGAHVVATDRNPAALRALREIARAERLDLEVVRTDLARGLGRFDRVLANPPYLPTRPAERDPDRWQNLALDGGPDGSRVTRRIVRALPHLLADGGRAFLLVSSLQSLASRHGIRERWRAGGGAIRTVASRALEGERLSVWELRRARRPASPTRAARRARGRRRGTYGRRRSRTDLRFGSSPAPGRGRSTVPDAASARRRSPPGS